VWHLLFQIALPLPFATASWYLLEQPMLRLKCFFASDNTVPSVDERVPATALVEAMD
jgi:peptidoglycan/LPS O-acetylase OafA/YrhL